MELAQWVSKGHGRQAALARAIDAQPQLVYQWATGRRPIPLDRCVAIEKATGGEVTCEEQRPDKRDYFAYLRGLAAPQRRKGEPNHRPRAV